jgi:acyl carrier protein
MPSVIPDSTTSTLTSWLADRVALYLRKDPHEIDPTVPLAAYGLDSVVALSLCGDIEEEYDLVLDVTIAWDYPTLEALADHLADFVEGATAEAAGEER